MSDSRIAELVFRTDSRTAIRGLREIADQGDQTERSLRANAEQETASFDRVGESAGRLRDTMSGLVGLVGLGGVAFGFKDLVQGGMALQAAQVQLRQALADTGQTAAGVYARLTAAADQLSTHGGFAAVQNVQALAAFVRETRSASQAQRDLALATNIARARNIDLATAEQAVARAQAGSIGRLQQLIGPMVASRAHVIGLTVAHEQQIATLAAEARMMGSMGSVWLRQQEIADHLTNQQIEMATLADKHATAVQVLAAATRAFGGATQAYADTTQGKITALRNSFQNLTEAVGEGLLPIVNSLVSVFTPLAAWMDRNKTAVLALAGGFAALGAALELQKGIKAVISLYGDVTKLIARLPLLGAAGEEAGAEVAAGGEAATVGWGGLFTLLAGAGLFALVELVTHFQMVEQVAVGVWNTITNAVASAWQSIRRFVADGVTWVIDKVKWLGERVGSVFSDTPLGGLIGFGESLLSGHVGRAFGDLAQGATLGAYQASSGSFGVPGRNIWQTGGQLHVAAPVAIRIDGREVANATLRYVLNRAARGPSNLVGGSLATGHG